MRIKPISVSLILWASNLLAQSSNSSNFFTFLNVTNTNQVPGSDLKENKKQYTTDPNRTFRTEFFGTEFQEIYRKAEEGDSNSQYMIGSFYGTGEKVPLDYKKALEWFRKSADQGNPAAQLLVGTYYVQGIGTARDVNSGIAWIQKASDQAFPKAQYLLGMAYMDGAGVNRDYQKAISLFQKASDQCDYEAMVKLGFIYYLGDLVPQDQNKARALWRKAASGGYKEAVKVLEMDKNGK
jgi:TPR repeat protein